MLLKYDRLSGYEPIGEFLKMGILSRTVWLAGGAIRSAIGSEPISDYDLFFRSEIDAARTRVSLKSDHGFEVIFKCPEGKLTTFKRGDMKVQCITENYYISMSALIDTFDISACRYATDGASILTTYSAVRDTLKKRIGLHAVNYPVATLKRVAKYSAKGYVLTSAAAKKFTEIVWERGRTGQELNTRVYID